jgi:hypothetical protein
VAAAENVGGSVLNLGMATMLSDKVTAGVMPARISYALASEVGFDDGQVPVSARFVAPFLLLARDGDAVFDLDGALPHLLVDLAVDPVPTLSGGRSMSSPSMNVGGM